MLSPTTTICWSESNSASLHQTQGASRWLESTVSWEWMHGHFGACRSQQTEDRLDTFRHVHLETLRRRTYINEAQLLAAVPALPLWRIRGFRFRAVGPRFLKPTHRTVVYILEEALDWANGVGDFADPIPDRVGRSAQPCTPRVRPKPST